MSCNYHVRKALLMAAAKKRFKNFLRMKEQFQLYLAEPEIEYCFCGAEIGECDHCDDCEYWTEDYNYCPYCGEYLC